MIPSRMMTAQVTVERHPIPFVAQRDRYNRPVEGGPTARAVEAVSAYYRPRRSNTIVDNGEIIEAEMQVIFQPDAVTDDISAVWIEGLRYEPDGQAQPHWHPISRVIMYKSLWLRKGTMQLAAQQQNIPAPYAPPVPPKGDTWVDEPSAWVDLQPDNAWSL